MRQFIVANYRSWMEWKAVAAMDPSTKALYAAAKDHIVAASRHEVEGWEPGDRLTKQPHLTLQSSNGV